jgi:hypothetical protein
MGVSMALILGTMEFMAFSGKTAKSISVTSDYNNLVSLLTLAMGNEETCRAALASTPLLAPSQGASLSSLKISIGNDAVPLVQKDKPVNGLLITDLTVQIPGLPDGTAQTGQPILNAIDTTGNYLVYTAQLRVRAQKTEAAHVGALTFPDKLIPFQLVRKASAQGVPESTIYDCFGSSSKEFLAGSSQFNPILMCKTLFPDNSFVPGKGCIPMAGAGSSAPATAPAPVQARELALVARTRSPASAETPQTPSTPEEAAVHVTEVQGKLQQMMKQMLEE